MCVRKGAREEEWVVFAAEALTVEQRSGAGLSVLPLPQPWLMVAGGIHLPFPSPFRGISV